MNALVPEQTIYLDGGDETFCAIVHQPPLGTVRAPAVVLCPPFGWGEVCSYRSRRVWAQSLAAAGHPTIRLSFPSTGDSGGGPRDPGRLEAWTEAIARAADWLRAFSGVARTAAIGIELGGLIAYRAAATGACIDDLVLWGTPARARSLVRQLRAFSGIEISEFFKDLEPPPPLPEGELEAGGFLLSAETMRELERLDLSELGLPDCPGRRVLLLDRDGIPVDGRLRQRLERDGASVIVASGRGYAQMSSHPQTARPPLEVIDLVTRWLASASAPDSEPRSRGPDEARILQQRMRLSGLGEIEVVETPFVLEQPFGRLVGILAAPVEPREPGICAVLLNAGAIRRIGPNRMWVEAARRWAARGVPTLRLDVEGIGDADGDATPYAEDASLYVPELIPQVLAALDALEERGIGNRFVLTGLCAGAYWSFQAALRDPRVIAALMVNPRALVWDPALLPARDFRALLRGPGSWAKLPRLASVARVRRLALWLLRAAPRRLARMLRAGWLAQQDENDVDRALDRLIDSGKRAMLLFACDERLRDELIRSGRMSRLEQAPAVTLEYVQVRDHTLRPSWAQRQAHAALDRALERELEIDRGPRPVVSAHLS